MSLKIISVSTKNEDELLEETKRRALQRQRRYWIWRAFLPAMLALPVFWFGFGIAWAVFPLGALAWNGRCAFMLMSTLPDRSPNFRIAAGIGTFFGLALLNAVIGYGLIAGSCALSGEVKI